MPWLTTTHTGITVDQAMTLSEALQGGGFGVSG